MTLFAEKVVLVTGGGTGIGRATALAFAKQGAHVAIAGRTFAACDETAKMILDAGGIGFAVACDVSSENEVMNLLDDVERRLGPVDIGFLNAGVGTASPIIDQDIDAFEEVMRTNCTGLMLCMKHLLKPMYERRSGCIVNNLSVHAHRTILEGTGAYTASKHAALALTKTAAIEAAPYGVRVNGVSPGPIATDMLQRSSAVSGGLDSWANRLPVKRVGESQEVAHAVLWLCSPQASFITGAIMPVDGGFLAS